MNNRHLFLVGLSVACALPNCSGNSDDFSSNGGSSAQSGNSGSAPAAGRSGAAAGATSAGADSGGENSVGGANAGASNGGVGNTSGSGVGGSLAGGGAANAGTGGSAPSSDTCQFPNSATLTGASVPDGYCAYTWASNLNRPRGMVVDANGNVLVSDQGRIVLLHDDNGNGVSDANERVVLRTQAQLNHGIALNGGYLYASTTTTVYRWPYAADRQMLGNPQQVVTGMPTGGHVTRTIQFDTQGRMYVSIGSASNVDQNSNRSRLLRYAANVLGNTSTVAQGEVFADGLRNEVGLAIDSQGRIWGVENGRDNLQRQDLGNDIRQDNPGEELNLFLEENAGRFYGYPYCWSEFNLPNTGSGPGTQWADPDNTTRNDAWCKNTTNVIRPVAVMQGHSAPLDIKFYTGGSFPADVVGDAFVTFHGSWNRTTATGYKVVRIPFGNDGMPSGAPVPVLESANPGDNDPQWPHRPVAMVILERGQLLVSSDTTGVILAVGHENR